MITEYDLQALLDHELGSVDEKRVRSIMNQSPKLSQRYAELCRQKALLQEWWRSQNNNRDPFSE